MKSKFFLQACAKTLGVALGLYLVVPQAYAHFEASIGFTIHSDDDFYAPLSQEGAWLDLSPYGRCWRPADVSVDWRPYCNGNWEWTDCGWYWESDEPWAWACYHYGSWADDPNYGWVWVPGTQWAPAWVYWRTGDDCIGWAPCGPSGIGVEPSAYVFVRDRHFHDHIRPDTVIFNDHRLIERTTEIRNVERVERDVGGRRESVVVNNGPGVDAVERASGHRFNPIPVREATDRTIQMAPERVRRSIDSTVRQNHGQNGERDFGQPQRQRDNPNHNYNNSYNNNGRQQSPERQYSTPGHTQPERPAERQNAVPNPNYLERQRQGNIENGQPNNFSPQRGLNQPPNDLRNPNGRSRQEVPRPSLPEERGTPRQYYQPQPGSEVPQRSSVPERSFPQSSPFQSAPSERQVPSPRQETPRHSEAPPSREMVSPGQMSHPGLPSGREIRPERQAPQVPSGQAPNRGNGEDKRDHGQ